MKNLFLKLKKLDINLKRKKKINFIFFEFLKVNSIFWFKDLESVDELKNIFFIDWLEEIKKFWLLLLKNRSKKEKKNL